MKKITINLSLLFMLGITANAQVQVPNAGFENWTNHTSYEDLPGWETMNQYSSMGYPVCVTKTTDAHTGAYAVQLENKTFFNFNTMSMDSVMGYMVTGDFDANQVPVSIGFPVNEWPTSFQGFYKYSSPANDSMTIVVFLTKYNPVDNASDPVGFALVQMGVTTTYTGFNVPITDISSGPVTPDSAFIEVYCSNLNTFRVGSVLKLDDLSFSSPSGISAPLFEETALSVYPNPTAGIVNIECANKLASFITVCDATGRTVHSSSFAGKHVLNTEAWADGLYMYSIFNETGELAGSGRLQVAKGW